MSNLKINVSDFDNLDAALAAEAKARKVSVSKLSNKVTVAVTDAFEELSNKPAASPRLTKKEIASNVFAGMAGPDVPRKDVVAAIADKANLSVAGARNYYQRFFSGEWEV